MAGKTRELKVRIKAVGNIQRITKTMQMIATARFQAMQRRATQAQAYANKLAEVVGELTAAVQGSGDVTHPLLSPPEPKTGRELVLIISSNRGLCGGYNGGVMRTATQHIKAMGLENVDIEIVGKKGMGILKFAGIEPAAFHEHIGETPAYEDVDELAERYMDAFVEGRYDAIRVVSMAFLTMSKQEPRNVSLLPMQPPTADEDAPATGDAAIYEFSPEPEALLGTLLPQTVKTKLFQMFNEAVVSEQLARMVAMKAATDSAGKMKKEISRQYNRARQAAITTELTEIIGGVAALE